MKDRIKEIFLGMTEEKVDTPIGSDKVAGYVETSDEDYDVSASWPTPWIWTSKRLLNK